MKKNNLLKLLFFSLSFHSLFFLKTFAQKIQKEKEKELVNQEIKECLATNNPIYFRKDLEQHYQDLLHFTTKYRNIDHKISRMEEKFIQTFMNESFSSFNGMFPLFINWCDYGKLKTVPRIFDTVGQNRREPDRHAFDELKKKLRDDVLYIAISQGNDGLEHYFHDKPNVLVFSAGGRGHVALPLIKHEFEHLPSPNDTSFYNYTLTFLGTKTNGKTREILLNTLENEIKRFNKIQKNPSHKVNYLFTHTPTWIEIVKRSMFNIAPEGRGRGTFRLSEIVQLGRIPVILHYSIPWIPYEGSPYSSDKLGFQISLSNIPAFLQKIPTLTSKKIQHHLNLISAASPYYHLDGVMDQFREFFRSPFKSGLFRCTKEAKKLHTEYKLVSTDVMNNLF